MFNLMTAACWQEYYVMLQEIFSELCEAFAMRCAPVHTEQWYTDRQVVDSRPTYIVNVAKGDAAPRIVCLSF